MGEGAGEKREGKSELPHSPTMEKTIARVQNKRKRDENRAYATSHNEVMKGGDKKRENQQT